MKGTVGRHGYWMDTVAEGYCSKGYRNPVSIQDSTDCVISVQGRGGENMLPAINSFRPRRVSDRTFFRFRVFWFCGIAKIWWIIERLDSFYSTCYVQDWNHFWTPYSKKRCHRQNKVKMNRCSSQVYDSLKLGEVERSRSSTEISSKRRSSYRLEETDSIMTRSVRSKINSCSLSSFSFLRSRKFVTISSLHLAFHPIPLPHSHPRPPMLQLLQETRPNSNAGYGIQSSRSLTDFLICRSPVRRNPSLSGCTMANDYPPPTRDTRAGLKFEFRASNFHNC